MLAYDIASGRGFSVLLDPSSQTAIIAYSVSGLPVPLADLHGGVRPKALLDQPLEICLGYVAVAIEAEVVAPTVEPDQRGGPSAL